MPDSKAEGDWALRTPGSESESPLNQLTPREAELLKKAGERVYALSRKAAEREREAQTLQGEAKSLRDLLAESHEVRKVLAAQVQSLQTELDREYEERSELRRLLASLHVQMQELLPVITGLTRPSQITGPAEPPKTVANAPRNISGIAGRLRLAARELRGERNNRR